MEDSFARSRTELKSLLVMKSHVILVCHGMVHGGRGQSGANAQLLVMMVSESDSAQSERSHQIVACPLKEILKILKFAICKAVKRTPPACSRIGSRGVHAPVLVMELWSALAQFDLMQQATAQHAMVTSSRSCHAILE
jgi:hypothetical protein